MKSSLSLENQMKIPYIGYWNKIIQYIVLFNIHSQYLFDSYLILFTIIIVAVDARCNQSWSIDCNEIKSYDHTFQLHRLSLAALALMAAHSVVARTHQGVTSRGVTRNTGACPLIACLPAFTTLLFSSKSAWQLLVRIYLQFFTIHFAAVVVICGCMYYVHINIFDFFVCCRWLFFQHALRICHYFFFISILVGLSAFANWARQVFVMNSKPQFEHNDRDLGSRLN